MAFPQIDTSLGSLLITVLLWFWTLKRAKVHLFQQENILRQQNRAASWSIVACFTLQLLSLISNNGFIFSLAIGIACSFVLISFILSSHRRGEGFWSKQRNQLFAGLLVSGNLSLLAVFLKDLYFLPILTALLIANICQRRFATMFSNSLRDLEALQAKLMSQQAKLHNDRQNDLIIDPSPSFHLQEKHVESRA